jgi:hypothetical protein
LIVTAVEAVLLTSLTEVAVIVTVPPWGGTAAAVYVVVAPLADWLLLNEPQDALGMQLHLTPLFAVSLETVAAIAAAALICIDAGGGVVMESEIAGGVVIVILAVALLVVSLTEVAAMVTLPP